MTPRVCQHSRVTARLASRRWHSSIDRTGCQEMPGLEVEGAEARATSLSREALTRGASAHSSSPREGGVYRYLVCCFFCSRIRACGPPVYGAATVHTVAEPRPVPESAARDRSTLKTQLAMQSRGLTGWDHVGGPPSFVEHSIAQMFDAVKSWGESAEVDALRKWGYRVPRRPLSLVPWSNAWPGLPRVVTR